MEDGSHERVTPLPREQPGAGVEIPQPTARLHRRMGTAEGDADLGRAVATRPKAAAGVRGEETRRRQRFAMITGFQEGDASSGFGVAVSVDALRALACVARARLSNGGKIDAGARGPTIRSDHAFVPARRAGLSGALPGFARPRHVGPVCADAPLGAAIAAEHTRTACTRELAGPPGDGALGQPVNRPVRSFAHQTAAAHGVDGVRTSARIADPIRRLGERGLAACSRPGPAASHTS